MNIPAKYLASMLNDQNKIVMLFCPLLWKYHPAKKSVCAKHTLFQIRIVKKAKASKMACLNSISRVSRIRYTEMPKKRKFANKKPIRLKPGI